MDDWRCRFQQEPIDNRPQMVGIPLFFSKENWIV